MRHGLHPVDSVGRQPVGVLVVDDEATLGELLSMVFRHDGWRVEWAATGQEAVRLARELQPDVVVLDVMLPDADGLEVLRRLRAELPDVPVLFLTARDAVEDRIAGLTAGGDDYVTKPLSTFPGRTTHERGPVRNYRRRPRPANSQIGTVTVHADWLGLARRPSRELVTCGAVGIVSNVAG